MHVKTFNVKPAQATGFEKALLTRHQLSQRRHLMSIFLVLESLGVQRSIETVLLCSSQSTILTGTSAQTTVPRSPVKVNLAVVFNLG